MENVIIASIPAIISAAAAYLANRSKNIAKKNGRRLRIQQARLDERDMIMREGGTFMIPLSADHLWREYLHHRNREKTRAEALELIEPKLSDAPNPLIGEELNAE